MGLFRDACGFQCDSSKWSVYTKGRWRDRGGPGAGRCPGLGWGIWLYRAGRGGAIGFPAREAMVFFSLKGSNSGGSWQEGLMEEGEMGGKESSSGAMLYLGKNAYARNFGSNKRKSRSKLPPKLCTYSTHLKSFAWSSPNKEGFRRAGSAKEETVRQDKYRCDLLKLSDEATLW